MQVSLAFVFAFAALILAAIALGELRRGARRKRLRSLERPFAVEPRCPTCDGDMRLAKELTPEKRPHLFWSCERAPRCRGRAPFRKFEGKPQGLPNVRVM